MPIVPHSGNACSGMCVTPCDHTDCWQCTDIKDEKAIDNRTRQAKNRLAQLTDPKLQPVSKTQSPHLPVTPAKASILSAMSGRPGPEMQKTTITRAALEALCEKAGITMDWNNGTPVFRDSGVRAEIQDLEKRYAQAERKVLEEKVAELEKIAQQQRNGQLSAQAANSMAKAAGQQMDTMVNDIVKDKVEAQMRADVIENEARIRQDMKSKGATDADIDAAVTLLGWKPAFVLAVDPALEPDTMQGYFDRLDAEMMSVAGLNDLLAKRTIMQPGPGVGTTWDEAGVLTAEQLYEQMKNLRVNFPVSEPGIAIVHPSATMGVDYGSEMDRLIKAKIANMLQPDLHIGWKARIGGVLDA